MGHSSTKKFRGTKIVFFFFSIFMMSVIPSFSLHCYYVYNFKNHYQILYIQYQFIIIFYEILLNIKNKNGQIISSKLNYDRCIRLFSSITVCYLQYLCTQNIWIEII